LTAERDQLQQEVERLGDQPGVPPSQPPKKGDDPPSDPPASEQFEHNVEADKVLWWIQPAAN
jgi:hypothetical protein